MISDGTVCLKLMRMYVLLAILSLLVKGNKGYFAFIYNFLKYFCNTRYEFRRLSGCVDETT